MKTLDQIDLTSNGYAPTEPGAPTQSGAVRPGMGRDVHVKELSVTYDRGGVKVAAVSELSFFAPACSVTAIVGPSGSGKSSVLSCVAALLRPTSGQVWVGGIDVNSLEGRQLDAYRRHHVGVVHQSYNLIASLTVLENVMVPLELIGAKGRSAKTRASEMLDQLGLSSHLSARPHQLSGGQQQRVAVARALATDPSVVLADEPTAHLDGSSVSDVRALLRSVADQGRTVIVATHDDRLLTAVDKVVDVVQKELVTS